jgi:cell division protein ZapA
MEKNNITVKIMDRDFNVKCPPDKIHDLHKAAKYFDNKSREICGGDENKKMLNMDNLILITALNISHELLTQKHQNKSYIDNMNQQINSLQNIIERAISEER